MLSAVGTPQEDFSATWWDCVTGAKMRPLTKVVLRTPARSTLGLVLNVSQGRAFHADIVRTTRHTQSSWPVRANPE